MSGALSVVAFEAELNAIVKEYLDFSGFDKTLSSFESECNDKGKFIGDSDVKSHPNQKNLEVQHDMMEHFHKGKRHKYFQLWKDNLPMKVRDDDPVSQKLEFYLNIYFAIYPLKFNKGGQIEAEKAMTEFKKFIETRGSTLSQTTEFLPFYALPFVPNPRVHPSYKELFSDSWVKDLEIRIEKFLTLALKSTPQPRLFELYRGSESDSVVSRCLRTGKLADHGPPGIIDLTFEGSVKSVGLQGQVHGYQQKLGDSERKCLTYIKRYNKVQADYHSLIGITADLVDSLEQTIQGGNVTPEYLQQLCTRLFSTHMKQSVDLTRPGTAGDFLRQSIAPQAENNADPEVYRSLDYNKVKEDLASSPERKKAILLQALRWRITKSTAEKRDKNVNSLIQNDILGCTNEGPHRETMLSLLKSTNEMVRQYAARLFNAFASLIAGRSYLSQNPDLLQALMGNLKGTEKESLTKDMVLGALQKLSLRRNLQTAMIERGVIEWLVGVLEDNDSLSDYTLEYSVALLMNLCLRTSGKRRCTQTAEKTLKVLSDLLGHDNEEIRPYVNGALYSILAMPSIREDAKAMGMEEILKCFIKPDQPDMNRQIEFIIKQLNSNENGDEYESDDEEDEDEEEDQDTMEGDLDKEEIIRPQTGEMNGERLLSLKYSTGSRAASSKSRRKVSDSQMLQRPVTPSSRRASDQPSRPSSRSAVGGEQRPTGMDRPPTRSGSRPNTQDGERKKSPKQEGDEIRPSPKSLEKLGPGVDVQEYKSAFGSRPKIPRTPDVSNMKRPASRGSVGGAMPPQPQYSESGPRPSSAGKSAQ